MRLSDILKPGNLDTIHELDDLCELIANLCKLSRVVITLKCHDGEHIVGCNETHESQVITSDLKTSWGLVSSHPLALGKKIWDGTIYWSATSSLPIELILKQAVYIFEKLELVHRLSQEKELLETVTDHLGDVVWMTDPNKNAMIYISRAYEYIWERPRRELINNPKSFITAIDERDRERVVAALGKQTHGNYREQYRIRTPSGIEKWIEDRAFPVVGEDGKVKLVVGIASDITAQKEAETLLDRQRSNLILSERFKSLGEMAGGIAHEINNPLAVAQVRIQLVKEILSRSAPDLNVVRSGVEIVDTMLDRVAKIIRSMRALARDSSDDEPIEKDLWDVIGDTLQFLSPKMKQSSVTFAVETPLHRKIRCRPSEISQALLNLLSNAYDAVEGKAGAWVRLDAVEDENSVTIRVTDSGSGIPMELFYKIWDPFFTTKAVDLGNGLGLPISKTLVERHGGSLTLDLTSENTRFLLRLPKAS